MPIKSAKRTPQKHADKKLSAPQQTQTSGRVADTLPRSLVITLPVAATILHHVKEIAALRLRLDTELQAAKAAGAPTLARAFVVFQKLIERVAEELDLSDTGKIFSKTFAHWRTTEVPLALEQAGLDNVPLSEGFRVGVSHVWRASIVPGQKDEAYNWLRKNGLADLITVTVNSSTLSAAAKKEMEEHNREFPSEFFNSAQVPQVSVTKTK